MIDPPPTLNEVEALIAQNETIRRKWMGNAGYKRTLDIEIAALQIMRDHLLHDDLIEKLKR